MLFGSAVRQAFSATVRKLGRLGLSLEGLPNERLEQVPLMQHFGFASALPAGADVVVLPLNGSTKNGVVIASRLASITVDLQSGDTCVFDNHGHRILLNSTGVKITADVEVTGNLTANSINDSNGSMQAMREVFNAHGGHTPNGLPEEPM